ncbi:MAG: trp operon repressor [Chlamydiae bacterium]|nr:trp operon repressor [Chlamydiota bacterium]
MKSEEVGWRRFLDLCRKAKDPKELDQLFQAVLTPAERHEIAFRVLIFQELLHGDKTQREIAKDLPISLALVSRGSNVLKTMDPEVRSLLVS